MIFKRLATAVLLGTLAAATPVGSQQRLIGTVRGEVRKLLSNGRLIPGSFVTIFITPAAPVQGQARSTVTGWEGFYYFQDVKPGSYTLTTAEKGKPRQVFQVDLRQVPTTDVPPIILPSRLKDYRAAFANALQAIDIEDWSGAVYVLQQLQTLRPENPATRMALIEIYDNRSELYRPHFFLGLALQKLGDCDGALREWKSEESLGDLKSAHQVAIQVGRKACRPGR